MSATTFALPLDTFVGQQAALLYLDRMGAGNYTSRKEMSPDLADLDAKLSNASIDRIVVMFDGEEWAPVIAGGGRALHWEIDATSLRSMLPDLDEEERAKLAPGPLLYEGHFECWATQGWEGEWDTDTAFDGAWRMASEHDLAEMGVSIDEWRGQDLDDCDEAKIVAGLRVQFPDVHISDAEAFL